MSIFNHFPNITLTKDQNNAMVKIETFLNSKNDVFILKGYAGSGKTTLLKGVISYLKSQETKFRLMAPTGRAAKVIHQKTKYEANTIHKSIFSLDELEEIEIINEKNHKEITFKYCFKIRDDNDIHDSVIIIDEASMLSDAKSEGEFFRFGSGFLLRDLVDFSKINHTKTKFIFIGDPAQLPPVGMNFSPALDSKYLNEDYGFKVNETEIKEVKRQKGTNGILKSANNIRKCLTAGYFNDFNLKANNSDIFNVPINEFLKTYNSVKSTKTIICYKNKTANGLNNFIRKNKYGADLPIRKADVIIIGGNNYNLGIMNGEFGVVLKVSDAVIQRNIRFNLKGKEKANVTLKWKKVELLMTENSNNIEGYILENYLEGDGFLSSDEQRALYIDFRKRNPTLKPKTELFKETIKEDPFFNAIFLKYGYAITCHKSQGGEWDTTFVFWDKGSSDGFDFYRENQNKTGKTNSDFYRWAYTAITRSSDKLFCINPPYFNSFSTSSFIDIEVQNSIKELNGENKEQLDILVDEKYTELINRFGLTDMELPLQEHFIKIISLLNQHSIKLIGWEKVNYEVRYFFKKGEENTEIKFWINGKNQFKENFQKIPRNTNSDSFFEELSILIPKIANINILFEKTELANKISNQNSNLNLELPEELSEEKPFLKILFELLEPDFKKNNITITNIEHKNYRERYTLIRTNEKAVIDFEYNKMGFFGRILPLIKECNKLELVDDIAKVLENLKK
ncbi:AAA family ATPase [Tenacibaculum finnmarkense]|uniref:ATP-dependent DNA helicase n=1 Tax=Tenacibaculum finnmarkense TaxID=2781243 RepID=UPI001EFBED02|nr:AAA family ATPase [Tenacibaculum finnmarkense]MCG8807435.1 AAA family ATPase [Tenacibaculum finnmarkense]MCG8817654.1 AAA family ATPase [Tenacibaculum finnmarkense]